MEYLQLIWTFFKIGATTFGGGYAMLPAVEREVVEKKGWATEEELLTYYAIGQCTPGIIAVNTATFLGQKRKGIAGGFLATLGMILPSLIIITVIAALLTNFADYAAVQHALAGIRVAVVVLVAFSVVRLGKSGIHRGFGWALFVLTFLASAFLGLSAVWIVLAAAAVGLIFGWAQRRRKKS